MSQRLALIALATLLAGALLGAWFASTSVATIENVSFVIGYATAFALQCPIIDRRASSNRPGGWDERIVAAFERWRDKGRRQLNELDDGG